MTDENQKYSINGWGSRLKIARESLHLTQKDIALHLHLSPHIIQALESEDFTHAAPLAFMRGYFRSYAKLLHFSEEDITQALAQSGLNPPLKESASPVLSMRIPQKNENYLHGITALILLIIVILIGIWWGTRPRDNAFTPLPTPVTSEVPLQQPPVTLPSQTAPNTAIPTAPLPTTTPAVANQSAPPIATAPVHPVSQSAPTTMATPSAAVESPSVQTPTTLTAPAPDIATTQIHRHKQQKHPTSDDLPNAMALPEPGLESN